jgi:hypothetical protein
MITTLTIARILPRQSLNSPHFFKSISKYILAISMQQPAVWILNTTCDTDYLIMSVNVDNVAVAKFA